MRTRFLSKAIRISLWYPAHANEILIQSDKNLALVYRTCERDSSQRDQNLALNFNEHVSFVCKKVNNQMNVMTRFRNLICIATKLKLYNAFILPHFQYCSTIWHFCSARIRDKLESLNKRALRVVLNHG